MSTLKTFFGPKSKSRGIKRRGIRRTDPIAESFNEIRLKRLIEGDEKLKQKLFEKIDQIQEQRLYDQIDHGSLGERSIKKLKSEAESLAKKKEV